ncbi:serine O-acetyltransferase [Bifidobacterium sp. UTBIF-78]|uniref:serine O-acetyltransferase n=1 Tax=Bifidobacterium sp. UTBIF-78 TaxID=1465263 RepID=UPI00112C8618|nr:serine acetyltransferase [Bifidobacterium sp. UTBIF-78]TPF93366.1 serine acetyltransferase [Bifidobacterium sp. UTBIF-78]
MITSREEYKAYLEQDRIALGEKRSFPLPFDVIWRFERLLRKAEFYRNCHRTPFGKLYSYWLHYRVHGFGQKFGFSIPLNVFGPGLSIAHVGTIVVNGNARVGKNCRIQECTTIGATNGSGDAPVLGDNVFLGSGARVIGKVSVADDVAIGANAVVVHDVPTPGITVAGVPARQVSSHDSHANLNPMLAEHGLL